MEPYGAHVTRTSGQREAFTGRLNCVERMRENESVLRWPANSNDESNDETFARIKKRGQTSVRGVYLPCMSLL